MIHAELLGSAPPFRIGDHDITGRVLPDGTLAVPAYRMIALIGLLGRPVGIAKPDLGELQRLEDRFTATSAAPHETEELRP